MLLGNIMEQVYNHTQDNFPGVHANNLKNAYTQLKEKATALYNAASGVSAASDLKGAVGAQVTEGSVGSPNTLREALAQLNSNASGSNVTKVFEKFNDLVTKYNALSSTEQGSVKSAFTNLEKEYSEAIYQYKFHFLTIPSMFTNWLNFLTFVILFLVYISGVYPVCFWVTLLTYFKNSLMVDQK